MGSSSSNTKFNKKSTAAEAADGINLDGKVVLITGCNTGLGKETVRVLALQGAKVFMLCRSVDKANAARDDLLKSTKVDSSKLVVMAMDLGSLLSVRRFVGEFMELQSPIDFLINNAGIMALPQFKTTADGIERQFGVNHLGHFYLTLLLTPILRQTSGSRVINLSSTAHANCPKLDTKDNLITQGIAKKSGPTASSYGAWTNYGISKACNILFAREYNERFGADVTSVSLHPGVIGSDLWRNLGTVQGMMAKLIPKKSIPQGAATTVRCVSLSAEEIEGGHYYVDCNEADAQLRADLLPTKTDEKGESLGALLWRWSELLITEKGFKLDMDGFAEEEKQRMLDVDEDVKEEEKKEAPDTDQKGLVVEEVEEQSNEQNESRQSHGYTQTVLVNADETEVEAADAVEKEVEAEKKEEEVEVVEETEADVTNNEVAAEAEEEAQGTSDDKAPEQTGDEQVEPEADTIDDANTE